MFLPSLIESLHLVVTRTFNNGNIKMTMSLNKRTIVNTPHLNLETTSERALV